MTRRTTFLATTWLTLLLGAAGSCASSSSTSPWDDTSGIAADVSDADDEARDVAVLDKAQVDVNASPDDRDEGGVEGSPGTDSAEGGETLPQDAREETAEVAQDTTADVPEPDAGETSQASGSDPAEPGPSPWTQASYALELPGGLFGTTIPLEVFLPDEPGAHPVIVFTHGYQLGPANYRSLAEHLASWGYVVVMPQLPGGLTTHKTLKEHVIAVLDWVEAQCSAPDGVLFGSADPALLGVSGHSMGGKISLLVASEDARPKAAFLLDPVDAAGMPVVLNPADYPSVTPELMPYVTIPLGLAGETTDAACSGFLCQACAPAEDSFQQYYLHAQSPALEITIHGAGHMSFLDDPDCGLLCSVCNEASDDPATTRRLTRRYMTAFYNVWLKGDDAYREYLTGAAMEADVAAGLVSWQSKHGFFAQVR